ncbi:SpoIIE family protein phosphatase [Streptomyces sp. PT12]|uniref:SpoIIE family protein phosphatase n=1 Tax=Streptomyces sp. PT12 TaxID=1510197 RepID=UPI00215CDDF0|nr:SpoIIE family protein phosphatase [Streptomyces sp. PT12]
MRTDPSEARGPEDASTGPSARQPPLGLPKVVTVVLDSARRVVFWGPTAEETLGFGRSDALGRPVDDFTDDARALRPPEGEIAWHACVTLRHRDGHTITFDARGAVLDHVPGEPLALIHMVEEGKLKLVVKDLATLNSLFNASPLGIAVFDAELRYSRANEALSLLHGAPVNELLGRTVLEVLPRPMAEEIHRLQRDVLDSGRSVIDLVTASPDGRGAQSVSFGRLTDQTGRVLGVSCTVMDITERREALDKIERARQRLALLNDVGSALGNLLDVRPICSALTRALVPRFGDHAGVGLLMSVARGEEPAPPDELTDVALIQLGLSSVAPGPAVDTFAQEEQEVVHARDSLFGTVVTTGTPFLAQSPEELSAAAAEGDPRLAASGELGEHSLLCVPLSARGRVLAALVVSRSGDRPPFDQEDLALAMELAARAGISLDNARLYGREREAALMLQRSLLPQSLPALPGVRVSHRYVPSRSGAEIGGDWFDVIPLGDERVAFVIGDATGHGLRAAATMGQLRTAVRTLAGLDLAPADLLRRLNDLGRDIAQPPDTPVMATCVYAVYDPAAHSCTLAKAGHLPPVFAVRDQDTGRWRATPLELPTGAPLGVDGVPFEEQRIEAADGAVLVLYTDGLIETRDDDISVGIGRLCEALTEALEDDGSLEDVCDRIVLALHPSAAERESDDIALLAARLGRLPEDRVTSWTFPAERRAVRRTRTTVRRALAEWGLAPLADRAALLVSELVTNAVRHAGGPIQMRMVLGATLLVEVTDPVPDPPLERDALPDDEGGRGLLLVASESRRWGTRREPAGKTVWFELTLPD